MRPRSEAIPVVEFLFDPAVKGGRGPIPFEYFLFGVLPRDLAPEERNYVGSSNSLHSLCSTRATGCLLGIVALACCCLLVGCSQPAESVSIQPTLKANAGPDQIVHVGNYLVLDASPSTPGVGDTLGFTWAADTSNPGQTWMDVHNPRVTVGFPKEGLYRFMLVVNNGLEESAPDTIQVVAHPRTITLFDDPVLEIQIRYALEQPTSELTDLELQTLDSLRAYAWLGEVTSLQGIAHCAGLRFLGLSRHRITDVSPVAELTSLEGLGLDQNRNIVDVSGLSGLTRLRWLNLRSNRISDISSLHTLTSLEYFNGLYNPIVSIEALENLTALKELWLGQSSITDISSLSGLTSLEILWLSAAQVSDLHPVSQLTRLKLLHLGSNRISDIDPLANCALLERLYLDNNQIIDLSSLEHLTSLNLLDLTNNRVTNILPLVLNQGLRVGDAVNLRGNPLDSVSVREYIPELADRGVQVAWP